MNFLKFFHIIHNVYFKQKHFIKRKYYSNVGEDLFLKKKLNLKKKGFKGKFIIPLPDPKIES